MAKLKHYQTGHHEIQQIYVFSTMTTDTLSPQNRKNEENRSNDLFRAYQVIFNIVKISDFT